jgi:hypothetical protein
MVSARSDGGAHEEGNQEMAEQNASPDPDYAVDPVTMRQAIEWYLVPVITEIEAMSSGFTAAHSEVKTAHGTEAAGWFGGVGNGELRMASSSFLNAAEWQLRQLTHDQAELAKSLQEYQMVLNDVITQAEQTDQRVADRFRAIDHNLEEMGH